MVVHAVSTRFFKKVGAGLLETRHHIMKLLISKNIFFEPHKSNQSKLNYTFDIMFFHVLPKDAVPNTEQGNGEAQKD